MTNHSSIMIYITAPSNEEAQSIAEVLIAEKLVACANIFPAHQSLYHWQGKVERSEEVAVIFKTQKDLFDQVEAKIKALHSYDVPCIVAFEIGDGHAPFLEWIKAETSL